jgi:translation elongation factor P/translation initiation factor 5A
MSARTALAFSLAYVLLAAPLARAQMEAGDAVTTSATVESIDLATRTLVLKGADGTSESVVVPESIANLDKLKVGDTVTTTYAVSVAAELLKPGEEPAPVSVSAAKQGGGKVEGLRQTSAVLKVQHVDLATNSVTLTGPKGNTRTIKVKRPELQEKLKSLKPGDEVQITFTEAMAISVEPKK